VKRGIVRDGDPEAFLKAGLDEFQRIRDNVRRQSAPSATVQSGTHRSADDVNESSLSRDGEALSTTRGRANPDWNVLKSLNEALLVFPNDFHVHPKLDRP